MKKRLIMCSGLVTIVLSASAQEPPVGKSKAPPGVSAVGRIEPTEVLQIASLAAGRIERLAADFNDHVRKGHVLAQLEAAPSQVEVARGKARVVEAQAKLEVARAKLVLAKQQFDRLAKLRDAKAVDEGELEAARAQVEVAEGGMRLADAGLAESKAALQRAELDLSHCTIVSPIDGVVLDRRCTAGQVVAAGAGPALFEIASDLKKVHVLASVGETDVVRIAAGQAAQITVDALPGKKFEGRVTQVRLNAASRRGAAIYIVVIPLDNPDGDLLPYLTAKVSIATREKR